MPPDFIGTAMEIPSGTSCRAMAIAREMPSLYEAPKPEPIASPSGKLCSARPIPTMIPVFRSEFVFPALFWLNLFFTPLSHAIIIITPSIMPLNVTTRFESSSASGTRSKHTIAIIRPAANSNMKLRKRFEVFLKVTPIMPPTVVPNVPKNNPE